MGTSRREELVPQARALRAEGVSKRGIAAALGVSFRTVQRWASQDAAAGLPWMGDTAPPDTSLDRPDLTLKERLRRKLQRRLEQLVDGAEEDMKDQKSEDRMLKLCRILEYLDEDEDDPRAQLVAMERFAEFCVQNLSEAEMGPVRKATWLFLEELRREHS
ncbi:MAG: helix-turn-helix domain-containing protein [Planctomycetes bacterium]|nr:helix-turn-helix domain-containing protein [Planctomycetota bacterium]